jgi:hypothetical protein
MVKLNDTKTVKRMSMEEIPVAERKRYPVMRLSEAVALGILEVITDKEQSQALIKYGRRCVKPNLTSKGNAYDTKITVGTSR